MTSLTKSALATLNYFDIFERPLTLCEIWRWLFKFPNEDFDASMGDLEESLRRGELANFVSVKNGFYFLRGREKIIDERQNRFFCSERKIKRANKVMRFLRFVPGVRFAGVCNSLGWMNSEEASDIDIFVITAPGMLWLARFLVVSVLKIFRLRPQEASRDPVCPSFFVTTKKIDISMFALPDEQQVPDLYLFFWTTQVRPFIFDATILNDWEKTNFSWVQEFLPHAWFYEPVREYTWQSGEYKENVWARNIAGLFKKISIKFLPPEIKNTMNQGTDVIVNDDVLKFHTNDRRQMFRAEWMRRVENFKKPD